MKEIITALSLIITQIISYSTIYALTSLGMVIGGRAGIFNISGEGVMTTSAAIAFAVGVTTQSWIIGAAAGAIVGGIYGLVFITLHERYKVNQFIIGIVLIIAGTASGNLISTIISSKYLIIPKIPSVPILSLPLLSQVPLIGGLFRQSMFTYTLYVLIICAWLFTDKTKTGLEYRAVGENTKAADVVGIPVIVVRVVSATVGGMLMGLAGAYLPLVVTGTFSYGIVAGRGLMAIGIAIFANWKPQRIFISALIFATFEVIAVTLQLYAKNQNIYLIQTLPFVAVLLIMTIGKQKRFPGTLGEYYDREER